MRVFSSWPGRWPADAGPLRRPLSMRGFTLVELMVTMTVAVILMAIAIPSFRNLTISNKLDTAANDVVNAIHVARMEAIKRNAATQVCSNDAGVNTNDALGAACGTEAGAVWAIGNGAVTQVLAGAAGITAPLQVNGNMVALRFSAQGIARQAGQSAPYGAQVVDICTSQTERDNHRIITMTAGSILATTKTSGDCGP